MMMSRVLNNPNIKKPGIKARLKALELFAGSKIVEGARFEAVEKAIQELQDRYTVIETELIEPLQRLQRESQSD